MRWNVTCNNPYYETLTLIEAMDKNELVDALREELADQLWEIICDVATEYRCEYGVALSLGDVEKGLLAFIEAGVNSSYSDILFRCKCKVDEINDIEVSLPLSQIVLSYLDWCWDGSGTVDSRIGYTVEKMLEEYTDNSVWNIALGNDAGEILFDCHSWPAPTRVDGEAEWKQGSKKYFPIVWYGPEAVAPASKWTIWDESKPALSNDDCIPYYWFSSSDWDVVANLIDDADDAFLIWYTSECGYIAPDLNEIRENCPIEFLEDESYAEVRKKVSQYFLGKYLETHYSEIEITACVYSEKIDASICFGIEFDPKKDSIETIGTSWIWEGMSESFWENCYEFEEGVHRAHALCDSGYSFSEALVQIFGTFNISFQCNAGELELNFIVDNSKIGNAMYEMLPYVL